VHLGARIRHNADSIAADPEVAHPGLPHLVDVNSGGVSRAGTNIRIGSTDNEHSPRASI